MDKKGSKPGLIGWLSDALLSPASPEDSAYDFAGIARAVFEASREGIVITDAQSNILDVNAAFSGITGYAKEEVIGNRPSMMKSGRHDGRFYSKMWAALKSEGSWEGEIWDRRKDGEVYPKWLTIKSVKEDDGAPRYFIGVFSDLRDIKRFEDRVYRLANYDALTGLPNRALFIDRLDQVVARVSRGDYSAGVLVVNIDRFKGINESFGNVAGDRVLVDVSKRLAGCVAGEDTVARIGGDLFALIVDGLRSPMDAAAAAGRVLDGFKDPFTVKGREVFVSLSIGISMYPHDSSDPDVLMQNAEKAMAHAKKQVKEKYQFFVNTMNVDVIRRLSIETNIRKALEDGGLVMYYQPLVDMRDGRVVGMEALVRRDQDGWAAPPASFIQMAEDTGLIVKICEHTLYTACRQTREWQDEGLPPMRVAVNICAQQFQGNRFVGHVRDTLAATGLDPNFLELELTERDAMNNAEATIHMLNELKVMGIKISIDDFGTGFSSLSYLRRFPVDTLKVDYTFVKDILSGEGGGMIARSIIDLAHNLGLKALAEGIETEEQLDFLIQYGCDIGQGYYLSRPLPPEGFKTLVKGNGSLLPRAKKGG
ncbi:MAG: EAL domain-containing protein [Nitrospirae bacterium]|nr:EAL domain-containing protein [Nitrospirota bacterium]